MMKNYSIITVYQDWFWGPLEEKVVKVLNEKSNEGYEIITVSFSRNSWGSQTAYITLSK